METEQMSTSIGLSLISLALSITALLASVCTNHKLNQLLDDGHSEYGRIRNSAVETMSLV